MRIHCNSRPFCSTKLLPVVLSDCLLPARSTQGRAAKRVSTEDSRDSLRNLSMNHYSPKAGSLGTSVAIFSERQPLSPMYLLLGDCEAM